MRFCKAILLPLLALAQFAYCAEDYYKVRPDPPYSLALRRERELT
jgi:hypothetical protein